MAQHNYQALKLLTDRYSAHIKRFNCLAGVTEQDSDHQYHLYQDLEKLVASVLARIPQIEPSGNRMALVPWADFGNIWLAVKRAMTPGERTEYDQIQAALDAVYDRYEN